MNRKPWMLYFTDGGGDAGGGAGGDAGAGQGDDDGNGGQGGEGFKAITSQDDLNRIVSERVARERAKYGDYKDLKTKAAEFDKLQEANKTEVQKANDKLAAETARADKAEAGLLRMQIAAQHGITDADDIELFLTGTDKDTLTKQAKRLQDRDAKRGKQSRTREGSNPTNNGADSDEREVARSLFG